MKTELVALILSAVTINSPACQSSQNLPGQNIDLFFEKNSAQVSADQVLKLANWAIDTRLKYPILDGMYVGGLADASEKESKELAMRRAEAAQTLLTQFGFAKVPYEVRGRVYRPYDPSDPRESGKRVEIEMSPGCRNQCCD
jgi:hypothetical protein